MARFLVHLLACGCLALGLGRSAWAADDPDSERTRSRPGAAASEEEQTAPPGSEIWNRDTLTGDWGGARASLADFGIVPSAVYIGEGLGIVSGGIDRHAIYEGRLELAADVDLEKLAGWTGATVHASAYWLHGGGLSPHLGNLLPASNIEARRALRLFTAWIQQDAFDGELSVRAGQLAADDEFLISNTAANFINGTFGWAALVANNLPSGGPAFPLAAPGVRVRVGPQDGLSLLTAVFSGDPAGKAGPLDAQVRNASGTTFSFSGGTMVMTELQYALNQGKDAAGLPGTYKVGAWYHTGRFDDQRFDDTGLSLADPGSTGVPQRHSGDYAIYAVADQTVWREPGTESQGADLFLRVGGAPADRNVISFYVDGGVGYTGLVPGRDQDFLGFAVGYAGIGGDARDLDRDARAFSGNPTPVRSNETVLEVTYIAQVTPWWAVQPDAQYIFNPGGNVANPNDPSGLKAIPDAAVLGVRTTIAF